jgi:hypothetical protein
MPTGLTTGQDLIFEVRNPCSWTMSRERDDRHRPLNFLGSPSSGPIFAFAVRTIRPPRFGLNASTGQWHVMGVVSGYATMKLTVHDANGKAIGQAASNTGLLIGFDIVHATGSDRQFCEQCNSLGTFDH